MAEEPIIRPALDQMPENGQSRQGPANEDRMPLARERVSLKETRLLSQESQRNLRLEKIEQEQHSSVVVVYGPSGSGKTTVANILERDDIAQPLTRLITRPLRESDAANDQTWDASDPYHDQHNVFFSYEKYKNKYGYLVTDVLRRTAHNEDVIVILGDASKIPPFIAAAESLMPGAPVTLVRLDAPDEVIHHRLTVGRKEGFKGEGDSRLAANRALKAVESPQLEAIDRIYGQTRLISVSKEEVDAQNLKVKGLRPLTAARLQHAVKEEQNEATAMASARASHILRPRILHSSDGNIDPAITDILANSLLPAAAFRGVRPALKGGVATAIYLSSSFKQAACVRSSDRKWGNCRKLNRETVPLMDPQRPVSLDIDWTMPPGEESLKTHQELIEAVSGEKAEYRDAREKAIFHSRKIQSTAQAADGTTIELDAVAISRIQPRDQGFVFEFPYTTDIAYYHRSVRLPNGQAADLVPPEYLALEKLIAGRSSAEGKFDLFDAAGLLATQPIHFPIVQRIIESQTFDEDMEIHVPDVQTQPDRSQLNYRLKEIPISNPTLTRILCERALEAENQESSAKAKGIVTIAPLDWNADTIKQAAFIDRLLSSLDQIEANMYQAIDSIPESPTLAEVFGRDAIAESILALKKDLLFYAEYHLARTDVYVRKDLSPLLESF